MVRKDGSDFEVPRRFLADFSGFTGTQISHGALRFYRSPREKYISEIRGFYERGAELRGAKKKRRCE
jgi:hypothetical protein